MACELNYRVYANKMDIDRIIKYFKEIAEKDLTRGGFLTPNQKSRLKEKIEAIQSATGHQYTELSYNPETKLTMLGFTDWYGEYRADSVASSFVSFMDVFEPRRVYSIGDLLE